MPEFLVWWQNCPCAIPPLLPQSCLLVVVEASETRSAMTTVVIHVTDVNDNPPTFMKEEFRYVYTAYRKASEGDSVLRAECLFSGPYRTVLLWKILFISKNEICKILFLIRCKWNWCLMESMPTPQVHWATKQGNTLIMLWKKLGYYTCIKHLINAVIGQLTEISFVYILEWYVGDLICTLLIYRHYLFIMYNTIYICNTILYNIKLYCIILYYIIL